MADPDPDSEKNSDPDPGKKPGYETLSTTEFQQGFVREKISFFEPVEERERAVMPGSESVSCRAS